MDHCFHIFKKHCNMGDGGDNSWYLLTAMALNTNGKPAILLLDMLKCVSLSPMAVIRSERQVLEAALRELAVVG